MQTFRPDPKPQNNKVSRRESMDEIYKEVRLIFLKMCYRQNLKCPVTGFPIDIDSDVHHKKGRSIHSYADEEFKEKDIPLFIDPRFFLGVSRQGHQYIETHPEEAKRRGWTLSRLDTIR